MTYLSRGCIRRPVGFVPGHGKIPSSGRLIHRALFVLFAMAAAEPALSQDFDHAISRAVTVVSQPATTPTSEAISRAVTVVNESATPVHSEAISRAATVVNNTSIPVFSEAISRAVTAVNDRAFLVFGEAISRAATACNAAGRGDVDSNGVIDLTDLSVFVDVLLGQDTNVLHIEAADVSCDGTVDGLDIQPFVFAVLQ